MSAIGQTLYPSTWVADLSEFKVSLVYTAVLDQSRLHKETVSTITNETKLLSEADSCLEVRSIIITVSSRSACPTQQLQNSLSYKVGPARIKTTMSKGPMQNASLACSELSK